MTNFDTSEAHYFDDSIYLGRRKYVIQYHHRLKR